MQHKIPFLFASQKTGMTAIRRLILNKNLSLRVLFTGRSNPVKRLISPSFRTGLGKDHIRDTESSTK